MLKKNKVFKNWRYVTSCILKPERENLGKAEAFYEGQLKRKAFLGIL